MRVLVTGGTGFVGGHLVDRLSRGGYEIRCLVRNPDRAGHLAHKGAELVRGDFTDRSAMMKALQGCDWLMHLAALNEHWAPDPMLYQKTNVEGARTVMECALDSGVARYVHVSTCLVFGGTRGAVFTEESPQARRVSLYAQSKYAADQIAWEYHRTRGLPLVLVYPVAILGPGNSKQTESYVSTVVSGKLPLVLYPDAVATYVDVRDVVEIIVRAAEREDGLGQAYIAGKERLSYRELNQLIGELARVRVPRRKMPDTLVRLTAKILTAVADLVKRPPLLDMAFDSIRTMEEGAAFDGSKAERELGIRYTPVRQVLLDQLRIAGKPDPRPVERQAVD